MFNGIINTTGHPVKIDGATDSIAIGKDAGTLFSSDDDDNIAIGASALNSTLVDCNNNIAIGTSALTEITTGDNNIAIGRDAGVSLIANNLTVSIGTSALSNADHIANDGTVAIGYEAAKNLEAASGSSLDAAGTFVGYQAGVNLGLASAGNVGVTAIGYKALGGGSGTVASNTIVSGTALGWNAYGGGTSAAITADYGVAVGRSALKNISTGNDNIAVGYQAGDSITTGASNIVIGSNALGAAALEDQNIAIGTSALSSMTGTDGLTDNIAIGFNSGLNLDDGIKNVLVGTEAGAGTDGSNVMTGNVALGYRAGYLLSTSGNYNTVVGYQAGNTITSGTNNVCIGRNSDIEDADGGGRVAIGYTSVPQNDYEVRIGYYGAFQFMSALVTITSSDATADTAARAAPTFVIPPYAKIKSITAVVTLLSSKTIAEFAIWRSTDNAVSAEGEALTGTKIELLGAGATGTTNTGNFDGGSGAGGVADINCDHASNGHGILNAVWHNNTVASLNGGAGTATETGTTYIWVLNAVNNGDGEPDPAPRIRVCVEFAGEA